MTFANKNDWFAAIYASRLVPQFPHPVDLLDGVGGIGVYLRKRNLSRPPNSSPSMTVKDSSNTLVDKKSEKKDDPEPQMEGQQLPSTPSRGSMLLSQLTTRLLSSVMSSQQSVKNYEQLDIELTTNSNDTDDPPSDIDTDTSGEMEDGFTALEMPLPSDTFTTPQPKSTTYLVALNEWKSITSVDVFLDQAYKYYQGKGLEILFINNFTNWIAMGFVVLFTCCLRYCIDWERVLRGPVNGAEHPQLWNVFHLSGLFKMSWTVLLAMMVLMVLWCWQFNWLVSQLPEWRRMQRFYTDLLGIPDSSLGTCDFADITNRIVALQAEHPISIDKLDAHDIANRLMRRQNYLIALFNKDILAFDLPWPPLNAFIPRNHLTKVLEWNLSWCIFNHFFDEKLQINKTLLQGGQRRQSMEGELQRRFIISGCINALLSPFIAVFTILYFFYRYGEEIYRNPKTAGLRQYTPFAQWKFREFNELPHFFQRRLANSHRKAAKYLEQFHDDKLLGLARIVSFILGSCVMVLLILSVIRQDLLTQFELTPGRTALWYIGIFTVIIAICRSIVPDTLRTDDPSRLMRAVIEYTHYDPKHWHNKYHSSHVHTEFASLHKYKMSILLYELIGILTTPLLLCFALPRKSKDIVDFFREFTVHVEGIGYVCSFALFDFERHGNPGYGVPITKAPSRHHQSSHGKLEKSFISFAENHPDWNPRDALGSQFLNHHNARQCASPADTDAALEDLDEKAVIDKFIPGFKRRYSAPTTPTTTIFEEQSISD